MSWEGSEHNKTTGKQENGKIPHLPSTTTRVLESGVNGAIPLPSQGGLSFLRVWGRTERGPEWGQAGFSLPGMGEGSVPHSSRWERRRRSRTPGARPRTAPPGSGNSGCPPAGGRGAWEWYRVSGTTQLPRFLLHFPGSPYPEGAYEEHAQLLQPKSSSLPHPAVPSFIPNPPALPHPTVPPSTQILHPTPLFPQVGPTTFPDITHWPSFFTGNSSWDKR